MALREQVIPNKCNLYLLQLREGGFHFGPCMLIAGAAGYVDAGCQGASRIIRSGKARQKLAILEITGNVVRMASQKCFEILDGRFLVTLIGALDRQPVTRESVVGMRGDELLQHRPAGFLLRLGHGSRPRIISAPGGATKLHPEGQCDS